MDYPCLKCVLEYLEANQRFRLSSRCPALRKIERSIPLHLELLDINSTTIRINDCRYRPKKKAIIHEQRVLPEDIVFDNQRNSGDYGYYYRVLCSSRYFPRYDRGDDDDESEAYKVFPEGVRFHDAMRWLGHHLFEGRKDITTRKLDIVDTDVLRLPASFKIKVGILDTIMDYLDEISQFIHPKIGAFIYSTYIAHPTPNHPLIQTAKKIYLGLGLLTNDVLNITHKNIELESAVSNEFFERIIHQWISDGREIGSSFTFRSTNELVKLNALHDFKKLFNGRTIYKHMENHSNKTSKDSDALRKELKGPITKNIVG